MKISIGLGFESRAGPSSGSKAGPRSFPNTIINGQRRLGPHMSVVFNTPYALVDVTVCIFLRMYLVGMNSSRSHSSGHWDGVPKKETVPFKTERMVTLSILHTACIEEHAKLCSGMSSQRRRRRLLAASDPCPG
ncbi:hypothetical protein EVAR_80059_1 [Eumeta japonica]|uniref:Uncharacterized protein n=1 Tax=Eumeta variegata TaxID=151549 RepID=A0A4C1WPF0_EUMVA|nr:hypothetical protein EVAR_80059_1 [Eumeta japonica]